MKSLMFLNRSPNFDKEEGCFLKDDDDELKMLEEDPAADDNVADETLEMI